MIIWLIIAARCPMISFGLFLLVAAVAGIVVALALLSTVTHLAHRVRVERATSRRRRARGFLRFDGGKAALERASTRAREGR